MKKKITILAGILMILLVGIAGAEEKKANKSRENKKFEKAMRSFEMEAVIMTTKGNISFYLYPEAAPKNVANFVFLAKNNFYNGLTFHRIIPNGLIQGGDSVGDGTGTTGYYLKDEFTDWLTFAHEGMLAFANSGPDTNSSQFFITMSPMTNLNKKHTIIGGTKTREDLGVLRTLRQDDKILNIDIKGKKIDKFLDYFPEEVSEWESKLVKPAKR
ncbi:peptidylprolyl isomerase [Leptotrichia sp. HSP-342]|uniref:Peptidyl-prolyl cis-trans isomerase n=1 Tax=Leptotrichia mesophila TaxID=3239303 RepID=A0AB39VD83_9FUSO